MGRGTARRAAAMTACLCVMAVMAMTACGTQTLEAGNPAPTVPANAPTASGVTEITKFTALIHGDTLVLPDGRRIDVSGAGGADQAIATRDGWLLAASDGPSLWLVRKDGSLRRLVTGTEGRVAVGSDGRQLAWRDGKYLRAGHLKGDKVVVDSSTPAPKRGAPVFYAGGAVVLGYSETGGGWDRRDAWIPARGDYTASWNANVGVRALLAPTPEGKVLGLVSRATGTKSSCLAVLDPLAEFATVRTACLPINLVDYGAQLSPTGRWLAAGTVTDTGVKTVVLDLRAVFGTPVVTSTWDAEGGSWLDDKTYLGVALPAPVRLTRYTVGKPTGEPVTLRGLTANEAPSLVHPIAKGSRS